MNNISQSINSNVKCLYVTTQLCVTVGCVFLLMYIYNSGHNSFQLNHQHLDGDSNFKQLENIQHLVVEHDYDKETKLNKVHNKAEQKAITPHKPSRTKRTRIPARKSDRQQKAKLPAAHKKSQTTLKGPGINGAHINVIPMEPVNANYTRNIYFTVKTTDKYYTVRLLPLLLTWLQVTDKNKLSIVTDRTASYQIHINRIRKAGFNITDSNCSSSHIGKALCCKLGTEFAAYYNAVEEHPGEEDDYQWFCHFDDDVYVNVPRLSQFLQQYDPHKPYYIGKWPSRKREGSPNVNIGRKTIYRIGNETNHTLEHTAYQYATGAAFCISSTMMMEAKKYFNGANSFKETCTIFRLPDDMTVGFVIDALLGHNLTDVIDMTNEFDIYPNRLSLKKLTEYLTVSYSIQRVDTLKKFSSSLKTPLSPDPTKFLLYHCLLYPTVSWCKSVRQMLNANAYNTNA